MPTKTDSRFLMLTVGLAVFALALIWVIAFVITAPPRGFVFWVTLDFLSFVVVLTCLLGLNAAQRAKSAYRPSGATMAIVGSILALDVVVTLLSIAMFAVLTPHSPQSELRFAAWLAGVNGFAAIIAIFLYGFDISQRVREAPALGARAAYQGQGRRLAATIDGLARVARDRNALQGKIDTLMRELRTIQTSLAHSSGGGIGSWETGSGAVPLSPTDLEAAVSRVAQAMEDFAACPEPQWPEKLSGLEHAVASLQAKVEILNVA